jgi:peptidoglycan/LPS O-acetylase OafA/YrhL
VETLLSTLKSVSRIPSLDGLRAVSFLLVFGDHVGLGRAVPLVAGDLGVTIFFFLSGFIITTLMRLEFEKNGSVNLRHFWLRRALRILPPLFLVVGAAWLLTLLLYPPGTVYGPAMVAELLFYANYWGIYGVDRPAPGTGVVWSLAVEEHFYLLFPLLYTAMQKYRMPRQRQAFLLWSLCAAVLAWRCVLVIGLHATATRVALATDTRLDSILFGCALAVWNNPAIDRSHRTPNIWNYLLLPGALAALAASVLFRGPVFKATWYFSIQGVALTCVFMCAVRYPHWTVFRFLNWRPVAFIGALSYSLYLVHDVLLRAVRQLWPNHHGGQHAVIALAVSIVVAWTIYALVEKPCMRLRKKIAPQGIGNPMNDLPVVG